MKQQKREKSSVTMPVAEPHPGGGPGYTERNIDLNGVRLHLVEAGRGPLVVLLHGFPEFWYAWRKQIPVLAAAGYRVVVPDLRGYNLSDKPRGVRAYGIDYLLEDVRGIIDACGAERATVIGHDWGAMIAWLFAMIHPHKVDRVAALNGMHPVAFRNAMGSLSHLRQTYYGLVFQIPVLPEILLRARNYRWLRSIYSEHFTDEDPPPQDQQAWMQAMSRPGALTSMVNYYRGAGVMMKFLKTSVQPVQAPSLLIWGERDGIGIETALPTNHWAPDLDVVRVPEAGHWPHSDQPEIVNEALLRFLER
jgi:pimeloyl-ACP methyl ester carboxylesterase|tara:strand:+ start:7798 stop:8715 length:918 start_codon:yes stop_codon:yes gene_type:complete